MICKLHGKVNRVENNLHPLSKSVRIHLSELLKMSWINTYDSLHISLFHGMKPTKIYLTVQIPININIFKDYLNQNLKKGIILPWLEKILKCVSLEVEDNGGLGAHFDHFTLIISYFSLIIFNNEGWAALRFSDVTGKIERVKCSK